MTSNEPFPQSVSLKRLFAALVLWAGLNCISNAAQPLVPDEIIVKYKSSNRFIDHGAIARRQGRHLDVVKLDAGESSKAGKFKPNRLWQRIRQIRQDSNVLYAEPNFHGHFEQTIAAAPDDTSYPNQWWLPAVGDRQMWALGRGTGVVVAVIDTGVDMTHPDLVPNLLSNGYNFGDGNANPQDMRGHGTQVAGIIAASQNNGFGVSGLAPESKILPIKINVGDQDYFTSDRLANAIAYAVSQGAKIINLSLTADQQTQTVQDAIQSALDMGIIVVAAAGNYSGAVEFPANMPGVLGVAATDEFNHLASFSKTGPEITVAAPGTNILSTALGGGVIAYYPGGTSFSAPIVAATVADMLSVNPALPGDVISKQLRDNASVIGGGQYPFGSVNAGASGNSLVPHLQLSNQQFSAIDSISLNYSLPPTGTAVDVYVAVQTPSGIFSLRPSGNWAVVSQDGYQPVARGYSSEKTTTGSLFGSGAFFPSISLNNFPSGSYAWYIAMLASSSGRLVGNVIVTNMELH